MLRELQDSSCQAQALMMPFPGAVTYKAFLRVVVLLQMELASLETS